jgi:hypothetical protein
MNVGIVGSRNFFPLSLVAEIVNRLPDGTVVVSGGALGVDTTAEFSAKQRGLQCIVFPAEWGKHGKAAGVLRNTDIVNTSQYVIAFWDGVSHGTADSIRKAVKGEKPLTVVFPVGEVRHYNGAEAHWLGFEPVA